MNMDDRDDLTYEEQEMKRKSRVRLFGLLVAIDVLLVGYFVVELILLFTK